MPKVFPTMVTPFNRDGSIDIGAVDALVDWYWRKGCDGIFAACQAFRSRNRWLREISRSCAAGVKPNAAGRGFAALFRLPLA